MPRLKLTNEVQIAIQAMAARKWPVKRIAQKLGVSDTSVYKVLNPIRADHVKLNRPESYRDSAHKQAIQLLSSEIAEIKDNLMKRKRRMLVKQMEMDRMETHIRELEMQRAYLWNKHKGVTQP
jgi:predicted transcriptional regulator